MNADLFGIAAKALPDGIQLDAALDQWMTPDWAAEMLLEDALRGLGRPDVLEPSCGEGSFLAAMPAGLHAEGVEIDPVLAERARRATGRRVTVGDFRTVPIDRRFQLVVGNPPFAASTIDEFTARAHDVLDDEGVLALIMPAHVLSTTDRVMRWRERFAITQSGLPRALFPRISIPLVWARMVKCRRRTLVGFMLFDEMSDLSSMPPGTRAALGRSGTWRNAIGQALESLGGEADLAHIYAAVEPRRPSGNPWWRDKVRQELARCFERTGPRSWKIAA